MDRQVAIAFVQLGQNPAPTLYSFAQMAKENLPNANVYLITDNPRRWKEFPGEILHYNPDTERRPALILHAKRHEAMVDFGRGYWYFTTERLFALEKIYDVCDDRTDLLHFESDVLSFVNAEILEFLRERITQTAVPRVTEEVACASILYAPNASSLKIGLDHIEKEIASRKKWQTDMALLSEAISQGAMAELPWKPDGNSESAMPQIIFDGSAFGPYLLGQDPIHSNGFVVSGYQNPDYKLDLSTVKWSMEAAEPWARIGLVGRVSETEFVLANLHVHSKLDPGKLSCQSRNWARIIAEANGQADRIVVGPVTREIFVDSVSLITRLGVAKRFGFYTHFKLGIQRKIASLLKALGAN